MTMEQPTPKKAKPPKRRAPGRGIYWQRWVLQEIDADVAARNGEHGVIA